MALQASIPDAKNAAGVRPVRTWLFALAALAFLTIAVGGATRVTGSGLSITEWQPVTGALPPLSEAAWQDLFAKYRQTAQYELVNRGMDLASFKFIFWWEWSHRLLGRLLGIAFLIPFLYFLARGQLARALAPKLAGVFVLGAVQGLVGWYMVQSGLAERVNVSHLRLALHLSLGFVIFGALLWLALSLRERAPALGAAFARRRRAALLLVALVLLQAVLGALVAGLRAGLSHNTWPLMDGRLIPSGLWAMAPWYDNLFDNALTVQFNHRLVAYAIVLVAVWQTWAVWRESAEGRLRTSALLLSGAVLAQSALGVATLLAHVPLALALAHQAGAALVFGLTVWHAFLLRRPAPEAAVSG
jgi:cytochrome c oxidase assembly protein subunit 15